jgi:methylmalonyl-CoA mutase N-terminal domain/subunit
MIWVEQWFAIEQGYIQQEIQNSAYTWQQEIEKGERIVIGVNKFTMKEPSPKGCYEWIPSWSDADAKDYGTQSQT